jgi:hypothetical protein
LGRTFPAGMALIRAFPLTARKFDRTPSLEAIETEIIQMLQKIRRETLHRLGLDHELQFLPVT